MDDFFDNWTIQVRKGLLEFCILAALHKGEQYAYALVKRLCSVPGLFVAEGSIYPLLSRMRASGVVETRVEESTEGPARKYYRLTEAGRAQYNLMRDYLHGLQAAMRSLEHP